VEEALSRFKLALREASERLRGYQPSWARLVFHDDADGVTAAAITYMALGELGVKPSLVCLEKAFPEAIELIHSDSGGLVVYVDIGSAHAELISRVDGGRNLTLILDHHDAQPSPSSWVLNLNPELLGVDGETYASGSSVCYAFARELGVATPHMALLAVIGSSEVPGDPRGLNREALVDASRHGLVELSESRGGLRVTVSLGGERASRERVASKLTALSSVGYYRGGPLMAVDLCLGRRAEGVDELVSRLEEERRVATQRVMARVRSEGLRRDGRVQWIHVGDAFRGMGTKVIGTFLSYLSHQGRFIDGDRYLVGFMNVEPEIPGLGRLRGGYAKVSARAPRVLASLIEDGSMPPLSKVLPEAARAVGGFGDGHTVAASGVVPRGREREFVDAMNRSIAGGRPTRRASLLEFM